MPNRFAAVWILIVTAFFGMNFHCRQPDLEIKPYDQTFEVPVRLYPAKKSYSVADTIWIETAVTGKFLPDTKSGQTLPADSGQLHFSAVFNRFGTGVTNPPAGFCDVITTAGRTAERSLAQWSTTGSISSVGCADTTYVYRMGFIPKLKGAYHLTLFKDQLMESCPSKVVPFHATVSYQFQNPDRNLDVFNNLPEGLKGGGSGKRHYTDKVNNGEAFIILVE